MVTVSMLMVIFSSQRGRSLSVSFSLWFELELVILQNMRVRVLGGKTFCSKTGRMVVGEMKDKFLLVDIETVIHGSYR